MGAGCARWSGAAGCPVAAAAGATAAGAAAAACCVFVGAAVAADACWELLGACGKVQPAACMDENACSCQA